MYYIIMALLQWQLCLVSSGNQCACETGQKCFSGQMCFWYLCACGTALKLIHFYWEEFVSQSYILRWFPFLFICFSFTNFTHLWKNMFAGTRRGWSHSVDCWLKVSNFFNRNSVMFDWSGVKTAVRLRHARGTEIILPVKLLFIGCMLFITVSHQSHI